MREGAGSSRRGVPGVKEKRGDLWEKRNTPGDFWRAIGLNGVCH